MTNSHGPATDMAQALELGPGARRPKRRWWLAAIVLVLLGLGAYLRWHPEHSSGEERYLTQAAQRGNLTITVTATGTLEPTNQVEVGSELSGIVKTVEVDFNDQVRVGQALAHLDTSKLEAQVLQARAGLAGAQAQVQQARATVTQSVSDLRRLREGQRLSSGKAISQRDLETAQATSARAEADLAGAKAEVSQAEAALNAIATDLAKAVIRSPINGVVLTRSVDPGQTVAASLQAPVLFTLAEDLTRMELRVDVDEADVGRVREGQAAIFTVDAYAERNFPARITQVRYGAKTVDGVVTYETILDANNEQLLLRPGMTATAVITVQELADVLLVPNAALRFLPPRKSNNSSGRQGSVLSMLMARSYRSQVKQRRELDEDKKEQRVWVQREGQLIALPVTTGLTNGLLTEIIAGEVEPGLELVVEAVSGQP